MAFVFVYLNRKMVQQKYSIKDFKMVHLCRAFTINGACSTGSCSKWVIEWVMSECEGLEHFCT